MGESTDYRPVATYLNTHRVTRSVCPYKLVRAFTVLTASSGKRTMALEVIILWDGRAVRDAVTRQGLDDTG